jgi:hypothetical protein
MWDIFIFPFWFPIIFHPIFSLCIVSTSIRLGDHALFVTIFIWCGKGSMKFRVVPRFNTIALFQISVGLGDLSFLFALAAPQWFHLILQIPISWKFMTAGDGIKRQWWSIAHVYLLAHALLTRRWSNAIYWISEFHPNKTLERFSEDRSAIATKMITDVCERQKLWWSFMTFIISWEESAALVCETSLWHPDVRSSSIPPVRECEDLYERSSFFGGLEMQGDRFTAR